MNGLHLRQAEVENLGVAIAGEEYVLGLEIAMHDALGMRRREALCDLQRGIHRLTHWHSPRSQAIAQRLSFKQLGDRVRSAFVLSEVVDREDVRV